jgi:5'-AMP-activated protein kinase catalytic alpha subunit
LKPENLLLDDNHNIKIVDFGLSNTYKTGELLKTACGSPCYAAPEMIAGKRYNGLTVDIWSGGVILYAMLAGYLPFEDPNTGKLYKKILNGDYKVPSFVSKMGTDLIHHVLDTNPDTRYSIEQMRQHPWTKQLKQYIPPGLLVGSGQIPVDQNTLGQLNRFHIDSGKTLNCIEANKHNHMTTTYYLLLKRSGVTFDGN